MGFLATIVQTVATGIKKAGTDLAGRTTIQVLPREDKKMDDKKTDSTMAKAEWIKGVPNVAVLGAAGVLAYILFLQPKKGRRR